MFVTVAQLTHPEHGDVFIERTPDSVRVYAGREKRLVSNSQVFVANPGIIDMLRKWLIADYTSLGFALTRYIGKM